MAKARANPFSRRLPIPRVSTAAEIEIPIKPARLEILPGRKTEMWTYGGSFPGPTIRRPSGEPTRVTFRHELPRRAGELSVHLHGGHNTSEDDGQPGGLTASQPRSFYCDISPSLSNRASGNDLLIKPGNAREYTYAFTEDGEPERAAMHWYHDHRLDRTGENVWRGLAGMWITDDDFDSGLPLPTGKRDLALMVTDRSFDEENQLRDPFDKLTPPDDGATGKLILVNGAVTPFHPVSAQRHRLRILNASNFRAYNLRLSSGLEMIQIATEAGLMPAPVERSEVLVGPGERVEMIVDFAQARGRNVVLKSVARDGASSLGSKPYVGDIMQFRVSDRQKPDGTSVPASLRPLPAWTQDIQATPSFTWTVNQGFSSWQINGKTFDPDRVDATVELGTVAVWEVVNASQVAHLMHFHHTDWYLLERNGAPPAPHEDCLKETFFLHPFDRLLIAGKASDYTGKYVVHCHMLDHEDHGLMSQFEVVSP
ncbi:MAG: multicopper oxidase family protein [Actinomycetota bacterium]|nr:multicopper oxidase family protein [Actinomycetota bacterium]